MLKIWYYANIEYMKDAPSYFDNVYEDEWIEDSFVKEMIQDVDHCTVISSHVIDSPILGAITPRELSGGVKVLILMLKDDSFIYNMSNCGDNCAKWILKIAEKKDLTVYLQHIMRFEGELKDALYPLKNTVIFIEENNEFVFTKEFASYVKESGNYFVFVTRALLKMLPYSIHEIYEIITDGKRTDIKESYHEFKEIYSNYPIIENNKIQNVVTEEVSYK